MIIFLEISVTVSKILIYYRAVQDPKRYGRPHSYLRVTVRSMALLILDVQVESKKPWSEIRF